MDRQTIERLQKEGIEALRRAVEILGGQGPTSDVVGGSQQNISACLRNGQKVPAEWCIPLEIATRESGTEINRADLRGDLFGPDVQMPAPLRVPAKSDRVATAGHVEAHAKFPAEKARARG